MEKYIVEYLKKKCEYWKHDWIEEIQKDRTVKTFMNTVCKITKTHYFRTDGKDLYDKGDMFGVVFSKEGTGEVFKCGKTCGRVVAVVDIEEILKLI